MSPQEKATSGARDLALSLLLRIENGAFSNVIVPSELSRSGLASRDRSLVTNLVAGTTRRRRALDARLSGIVDRPIEALDPAVRAGLRLGAFQLESKFPPHAAVGETVSAVGRLLPHGKGYTNAVLRALASFEPVESQDLGVRTSHPDWIVERLVNDFGIEAAVSSLEIANIPPQVTLRARVGRSTAEELEVELRDAGLSARRGELMGDALVVSSGLDPTSFSAISQGRATPQDEASQAVVAFLDLQPGERIIDVAAAPGGKLSAIAELVGEAGFVVGVDLDAGRLRLVAQNLTRLGLVGASVLNADGTAIPVEGECFDRVLVDAPCSGLGVLRRRPDLRWRANEAAIAGLVSLQHRLVEEAIRLLRPGGTLVYSVCTFTAEETADVDAWLASTHPELQPTSAGLGAPWRAHGRGYLILPGDVGSDGMFMLRLEKRRAN